MFVDVVQLIATAIVIVLLVCAASVCIAELVMLITNKFDKMKEIKMKNKQKQQNNS